MDAAKKVALNTFYLYGKMLITMFISLYSTRLILGALGVEDFGIFNLVAGVIAMLSFLNAAMAVSTQRYLSYCLGANQIEKQKAVFSSSVVLHLIIGVGAVIILEVLGAFLFSGWLNIPLDKIGIAKLVYQFMIVSTFFTINAVPYDAAINAHENMLFEAIVGILESLGKLGIAFWLLYTSAEKLILYGILISSLIILLRIVKGIYCYKKYEECSVRTKSFFDFKLFKEMLTFASWNLFTSFCNVIRDQGLAIVLNNYLGVVINAAYGIASQVNGQLSAFSSNINKSLKPQIVKSEGAGDRNRMLKLSMLSCKLAFFLLALIAIPLIIEMKYVLALWLNKVPDYAVIFCRLVLIMSMIQQTTWGLGIAIQSVGKIKVYQVVMGILLIMNLPMALILMRTGFYAYTVFVGSIVIEIISAGLTVYFAHKKAGLNVKNFIVQTLLFPYGTIIIATIIAVLPQFIMEDNFIRLIVTTAISTGLILLIGWYFVLLKEEKEKFRELLQSFINNNLILIKLRIKPIDN